MNLLHDKTSAASDTVEGFEKLIFVTIFTKHILYHPRIIEKDFEHDLI
jgi:hypothetical protein